MDRQKIEKAVKDILKAIGADPNQKDLRATPQRVAEMYDDEVDNAVTSLTSVLEPAMIVVMAVVVMPMACGPCGGRA